MKFYKVAFFLCLCLYTAKGDKVYGIATFNTRGVDGTIKFMPDSESGDVTITVNLMGTRDHQHWHIHNLPVDNSLPPSQRCKDSFIGGHYDPFEVKSASGNMYSTYCKPSNQTGCEVGDFGGKFGPIIPTTPQFSRVDNSSQLTLFGRYGIIGRSIKIHGMEDVCATIYSSSEVIKGKSVTLLQAAFVFPFGGTMYFRQVDGENVVIFGKIYWVTDTNTTMGHNWHVHLNQPPLQYREGYCNGIGGHFNPNMVDTSDPSYKYCNEQNITNCEVGDLSNKHGQINIGDNPLNYSEYSFLYHDSFLNLTGTNAVINRSIAIHSLAGPVQGCAPLIEVENVAVADINDQFSASHSSRFDRTDIKTNYNTSGISVFAHAVAPNQLCQATFAAGRSQIYNPHEAPSLDGSDNTPDRYPVGDFGRKYNFSTMDSVYEFPIHGLETIAGHSLGFLSSTSREKQFICSSLWPSYPAGSNVKMAKATFNNTVTGGIYFIQRDFGDGVYGSTFIFVDIWYTNSDMSSTKGHNWHIHMNPPSVDSECVDVIGGHFNPFNVNISAGDDYGAECSIYSPLRCESGDLSNKHGQLNIDPGTSDRESVTYTDSNLNIFGPANYSIIGRSVGLHLPSSEGGSLFDCGGIEEVVIASKFLYATLSYDRNFDRTAFVSSITRELQDTSPSDLLLVQQEMTQDSSNETGCVNITLRVLGTTSDNADAKMERVQSQINNMYNDCSSGMVILPSCFTLLCLVVIGVISGKI